MALPLSGDFAAVLQVPSISPVGSGAVGALETGAPSNAPGAGGSLRGNLPSAAGGIPAVPPASAPAIPTPNSSTGGAVLGGNPILGASSQIGSDLVAQRTALLPGALARPDILGAQATLEARQA